MQRLWLISLESIGSFRIRNLKQRHPHRNQHTRICDYWLPPNAIQQCRVLHLQPSPAKTMKQELCNLLEVALKTLQHRPWLCNNPWLCHWRFHAELVIDNPRQDDGLYPSCSLIAKRNWASTWPPCAFEWPKLEGSHWVTYRFYRS